ncbi:hypothetical protein [Deinococcus radiophilus]
MGVGYHAAHIYLLQALREATGDARFKPFEERWIGYVN